MGVIEEPLDMDVPEETPAQIEQRLLAEEKQLAPYARLMGRLTKATYVYQMARFDRRPGALKRRVQALREARDIVEKLKSGRL